MTLTLADAQVAQRIWSEKQFPDRNPDHALMGLIEELGELCESVEDAKDSPVEYLMIMEMATFLGRLAHINLKKAQGIRKASTSFERECDAIDQLSRAFWEYYSVKGYPPSPEIEPEVHVPDVAKERDAVGDVLIYLIDRCNRRGWQISEILDETLATVLARNWSKNPTTGAA